MLKTGIYVDAENIRLSGGYGMRYDVLVDLANSNKSIMLRANSYLAEDKEQTAHDPDYRQKLYNYHNILRKCGFKIIKKYVKRFTDEDGIITTKANADMDLAIDALLQSRNLDRIILLTGDGDFIRLVTALQNKGCRVDIIAFKNVSGQLREVADFYISGFLVPGLLPINGEPEGEIWHRGTVVNYKHSRGFGFIQYYQLKESGLVPETIFFHCSKSSVENPALVFANYQNIFEFQVSYPPKNPNRPEAINIRLLQMDDF
jgi:uncharacterized LabA/DUF88 family protein